MIKLLEGHILRLEYLFLAEIASSKSSGLPIAQYLKHDLRTAHVKDYNCATAIILTLDKLIGCVGLRKGSLL